MPDWEENGSYFAKYMDFSEILYFAKRLFGDIPISFRASTDKNVGALFFAPERISEMEKTVLSVCREVFKAKNPGLTTGGALAVCTVPERSGPAK